MAGTLRLIHLDHPCAFLFTRSNIFWRHHGRFLAQIMIFEQDGILVEPCTCSELALEHLGLDVLYVQGSI